MGRLFRGGSNLRWLQNAFIVFENNYTKFNIGLTAYTNESAIFHINKLSYLIDRSQVYLDKC